MTKIKYNEDTLKFMSLFENLTGAKIKDCIVNDRVMFIVQENWIGKAIGKDGVNIRKLEGILKKKIKVVEFAPEVTQFIRNYIYPLQAKDVSEQDGIITVKGHDVKTRGLLIGRDSRNLEAMKSIIKRYFPIKDIKVQ